MISLFFIYETCSCQVRPSLMSLEIFTGVSLAELSLQNGALFINLQYFTQSSMGNITSSQTSQVDSKRLEELINLTNLNYKSPYRLSFNPFDLSSSSVSVSFEQHTQRTQSDFSTSEQHPMNGTNDPKFEEKPSSFISEEPDDLAFITENSLQKNQQSQKKNIKRKIIKKGNKARKISGEAQLAQEGNQNCQETQMATAPDQSIRDQNNCKSYHKLVKNFLQENNLGELIQKFEKKYHTRYYFIVALILIKYYVGQNFTQTYDRILKDELQVQQNKIQRKLNQKEKVEKRLRLVQASNGNTKELMMKKQKLEKQIQHIEVVKYEISQFSMRSCAAFFQGDLEESLKILYLKDDPIMRKKYYFDSALKIVEDIQAQVRKAASRKS